jgi:SAM-dependent methyltransferase
LERHRLLWLFLRRETELLKKPQSLLHFAPEPGLRENFRAAPQLDYRTADIAPGRADDVVDIVQLPYADGSYDAVLCCHVLEHIPDDARAMAELFRVLKPGGHAYLQVPIRGDTTDEDASIVDPEMRLQRFGQEDHVRFYGMDFQERLQKVGFEVRAIRYWKKVALGELEQCRLLEEGQGGEIVWVAGKPV